MYKVTNIEYGGYLENFNKFCFSFCSTVKPDTFIDTMFTLKDVDSCNSFTIPYIEFLDLCLNHKEELIGLHTEDNIYFDILILNDLVDNINSCIKYMGKVIIPNNTELPDKCTTFNYSIGAYHERDFPYMFSSGSGAVHAPVWYYIAKYIDKPKSLTKKGTSFIIFTETDAYIGEFDGDMKKHMYQYRILDKNKLLTLFAKAEMLG